MVDRLGASPRTHACATGTLQSNSLVFASPLHQFADQSDLPLLPPPIIHAEVEMAKVEAMESEMPARQVLS